jgi:endo-1,4-beta-xylanase
VYAWDVVNEAFNADGSLRSTVWADSPGIGLPGTAYIEQAFRGAHEADPKALLFYNDYDAEMMNAKSDAIFAMAKDFKARGVPIDGIGLQMHVKADENRWPSIEENIKRLVGLGLQVQITELDVRVPVGPSGQVSDADLKREAEVYRKAAAVCLEFPQCTAIQVWGVTDKYSWIPHEFPGQGAGLLFDAQYRRKPAFSAVRDALTHR